MSAWQRVTDRRTSAMLSSIPGSDWTTHALCTRHDPEDWFPVALDKGATGRHPHVQPAIAICDSCPVRAECLQWAVDHSIQHGVWGGLTPVERAQHTRNGPGRECDHCHRWFIPRRSRQDRPGRFCSGGCYKASLAGATRHGSCGSIAGLRRHRKLSETPCGACRMAESLYEAQQRGRQRGLQVDRRRLLEALRSDQPAHIIAESAGVQVSTVLRWRASLADQPERTPACTAS